MFDRFRRRATAEERRFDDDLAAVIAGQPPVDAPVEYGDDLIMAQELSRQLAPLSEVPPATESRLQQKIAAGVEQQERRPFWQRSFAARPLRTAAAAALVLALAVGVLSPLGSQARAAATEVWNDLVGPTAGVEELESIETNEDGSLTVTHKDGSVTTVPPPGDGVSSGQTSSDDAGVSDGSGIVTVEDVP